MNYTAVKNHSGLCKAISLLLCAVMLATGFAPAALGDAFSVLSGSDTDFTVLYADKPVTELSLPQDSKLTVSVPFDKDRSYQWQLCIDSESDLWVDVSGQRGYTFTIGYATVGSIVDDHGVTYLRCKSHTDDGYIYTPAVKVTVAYIADVDGDNTSSGGNTDPGEVIHDEYKSVPGWSDVSPAAFKIDTAVYEVERSNKIYCNGREVETASLPQDDKITLSLEPSSTTAYQWQVLIPNSGGLWANVSGQKQFFLTIGYATVASIVNDSGVAYVRCIVTEDGASAATEPMPVKVAYIADTQSANNAPAVRNGIAVQADGDLTTRNIIVRFLYLDGKIAWEPQSMTVANGSALYQVVNFPSVTGYLPYFEGETETSSSFTIDIPSVEKDYEYTIWYKPALVKYRVNHYLQNTLDDDYTLLTTTDHTGYTGDPVGSRKDLIIPSDGFNALWFDDSVLIAADGSTEIDIYYDRQYYLVLFDLDGGYGVDPVFVRHGTMISAKMPTRAGYVFDGWELIEYAGNTPTAEEKSACEIINTASLTVPTANIKFRAKWKTTETTYTVVYWTENADDDGYTYHSHEKFNAQSATVVNGSDHPKTLTHFTLNTDKTDKKVTVEGDGSTVVNVYYNRNRYTLEFTGVRYLTCTKEEHTHTYDESYRSRGTRYYCGGCYPDATGYDWRGNPNAGGATSGNEICGKTAHTHNNSCYDANKTTYTVTAKYDSDITHVWETDPIKSMLDSGYVFQSSVTGKYYSFLEKMPEQDITLTATLWSGSTYEWYYWLEVLPGQDTTGLETTTNNGKTYYKYHTTTVNGNGISLTYDEDYFPITGFEQRDSSVPSFDGNGIANLYYIRKQYNLSFENYGGVAITGRGGSRLYQRSIADEDYSEPEYPSVLEPNAYVFAGWYTTPQCFDGSEFVAENATMPAHDVVLYAKWAPKTHTVRIFITEKDAEPKDTQHVLHGELAEPLKEDPTNGSYTFMGWFYYDGSEKKAFDFYNMPINRDIDIFAEWSSNIPVLYTLRYVIKNADGTETEIADTTTGSALAGTTKTFDAKGGSDLYEDYREGYFPQTNSHTLLLSLENPEANEFTFVYVAVDNVPYTVRYVEKDTGIVLHEEKYVAQNKKSIVTETFEPVQGYMPDAYQKRLVLSANEEENVLTFYYTKDEERAFYIINYYVHTGDGYTVIRTIQAHDKIGTEITAADLEWLGCEYVGYKVNDTSDAPSIEGVLSGTAKGTLTPAGLKLDLYYERIECTYVVRYLELGTDAVLAPEKSVKTLYNERIYEDAIEIEGYDVVSGGSRKYLTVGVDEAKNIITFYYNEQNVLFRYIVAGNVGGIVSLGSETVRAKTGTASGSVPTANPGYRFEGWYTDAECTVRAEENVIIDGTTGRLTPQKQGEIYVGATYYAKFVPSTAPLTVKKTGSEEIDENQTFIFRIAGEGLDFEITVHGNGQTTVTGLPVGEYTVTEITAWSWRYKPESETQKITITPEGENKLTFKNTREGKKWIGGDNYTVNRFAAAEKE